MSFYKRVINETREPCNFQQSVGLSVPARNTQATPGIGGDWYELRPGGGPFRGGVPPRSPPARPRDVIQYCREIHGTKAVFMAFSENQRC